MQRHPLKCGNQSKYNHHNHYDIGYLLGEFFHPYYQRGLKGDCRFNSSGNLAYFSVECCCGDNSCAPSVEYC